MNSFCSRLRAALCGVLLIFLAAASAAEAQIPDAEFFAATITAQEDAQNADARVTAPDEMARAQKLFTKAIKAHEKGKLDKAAELGEEATTAFRNAELDAIKNVVLATARNRLAQLKQQDAKRHAPQSLALTEELLAQADARLNADRYDAEPAAQLAARAERQAIRTSEIAQIVSAARNESGGVEALLLNWESRMLSVAVAAELEATNSLDADTTSEDIVGAVQELLELRDVVAEQNVLILGLEDELRELDTQLSTSAADRASLVRQAERQARVRQQFEQVRNMFAPDEAIVLRDGDDLILRLVGLRFASNSAEIDAAQAPLMVKVNTAIEVFPQCRLTIEGHTDSKGKVEHNQKLSEERASAVMDYMTETLRVPAFRIRANGFGDSKPIASNRTEEGRASNRRIDLIISPRPESL